LVEGYALEAMGLLCVVGHFHALRLCAAALDVLLWGAAKRFTAA
jgi:hypothetical protein